MKNPNVGIQFTAREKHGLIKFYCKVCQYNRFVYILDYCLFSNKN